jgi:hypothetical protein
MREIELTSSGFGIAGMASASHPPAHTRYPTVSVNPPLRPTIDSAGAAG